MRTFPIEEFYDDQGRPLTAPSRPIARKATHPVNAHMHGSYAHCHPGWHLPHKHVIAEAGLCRPDQLAEQPMIAPTAKRQRLAKTA